MVEMTELDLQKKIDHHFSQLTSSQKKVAIWLRIHMKKALLMSAKEIGERSGASEATVHRLVVTLGYRSFIEMKSALQKGLFENRMLVRFDSLQKNKGMDVKIQEAVDIEYDNIKHTLTPSLEASLKEAAQKITMAKRIYVVGWRASIAITAPLSYQLNLMLGNTTLLQNEGDKNERIAYLEETDLVIASGFPRYCKHTLEIVKEAKYLQAGTIIFTDTTLSPFFPLADIPFTIKNQSNGFLDSFVTPLFVCQLLIQEVSRISPEKIRTNLEKQERLFKKWDLIEH